MKFWILALTIGAAGCDTVAELDDDAGPVGTEPTIDTDIPEVEDTGLACDATSLTFRVEARDAAGLPATVFAEDDAPVLAVVVANSCAGPVRFDTPSTCLVTQWNMTGPEDPPYAAQPTCTPVTTSWTIEASASYEMLHPLEALNDGDYEVTVTFSYEDLTATTAFIVE